MRRSDSPALMPAPPLSRSAAGALLALLSYGHLAADIAQGALPALLAFLRDRYDLSYTAAGGY